MPAKCCVPACKSNYDSSNAKYVSVFKFPKCKKKREQWIKKIPRQNWYPNDNSVVCIKHFCDSDIIKPADTSEIHLIKERPKLSETAVPQIFPNLPSYLPSTEHVRQDPEENEKRKEAIVIEENYIKSLSDVSSSIEKKMQQLPNDSLNWTYYNLVGNRLRMKKDALPSKNLRDHYNLVGNRLRIKKDVLPSKNLKLVENVPQKSSEPTIQTTSQLTVESTTSQWKTSTQLTYLGKKRRPNVKCIGNIKQINLHDEQIPSTLQVDLTPIRSESSRNEIGTMCNLIKPELTYFIVVNPPLLSTTSYPNSISTSTVGSSASSTITSKNEKESEIEQTRNDTIQNIEQHCRLYLGIPDNAYYLIKLTETETKLDYVRILVTLKKIRTNDAYERLGIDFGLSTSTVEEYFVSSLPKIAESYHNLIFWPLHSSTTARHLPIPFRYEYSLQSIIDCFEIEIENPSNPLQQSFTWNQYKRRNTLKYLISCNPHGFINFISSGFGGKSSDYEVVDTSGYLEVLPENSTVMANRGFKNIESLLQRRRCTLVRPSSVITGTKEEVLQSKRIASMRIHEGRIFRRLRQFKILRPYACNAELVKWLNLIVIIACGICNMQGVIIK